MVPGYIFTRVIVISVYVTHFYQFGDNVSLDMYFLCSRCLANSFTLSHRIWKRICEDYCLRHMRVTYVWFIYPPGREANIPLYPDLLLPPTLFLSQASNVGQSHQQLTPLG